MKTILVTGGAGFIGSHLCEYLVKRGDYVICLDNFFTGDVRNIKHMLGLPNFEVMRHDITDPLKIEVDEIYNLACPASPVHYQYNPVKTIQTSVIGVTNMLEVARETGAKILQASTSEVYGDPDVHPQHEEYHGNVNPIGPRACYDEGKRAAESLMMDYHRRYKIPVRIVRIFNTYGPKMAEQDGRVVSNFITQALNGENLTMYGDGKQTRSFCYVDDLVEGIVRTMNNKHDYVKPINLGNPGEFTMIELAKKVIKYTGTKSKIIHKELPEDDPKQRKPDIAKANKLLLWQPRTELDEGLRKTIEYFRRKSATNSNYYHY